jgi:hypothetical protein
VAWTLADGTWTSIELPTPSGSQPGGTVQPLDEICPGPDRCVVVGELVTGTGGPLALVETLDATGWTASLPRTLNPDARLVAVSCPVAGQCVAVGSYADTDRMPNIFGEVLADGAWQQFELPTIPLNRSTQAALRVLDVSCDTPDFCAVVADSAKSIESGGPFADVLANGQWTSAPLDDSVLAVSCATDSTCVAAGRHVAVGGHPHPSVETLTGSAWHATTLPLPSGATEGQLTAISCADATHCVAAGTYVDSAGDNQALLETLTGAEWTPGTLPVTPPIAVPPAVSDVSCATSSACTFVGHYPGSGGIVEFAVGVVDGQWAATTLPTYGGGQTMDNQFPPLSVDCPAATACIAAGAYVTPDLNRYPILDVLRGGVWSLSSPDPLPRSLRSTLAGISCADGGSCIAVGEVQFGAGDYPLVETSN